MDKASQRKLLIQNIACSVMTVIMAIIILFGSFLTISTENISVGVNYEEYLSQNLNETEYKKIDIPDNISISLFNLIRLDGFEGNIGDQINILNNTESSFFERMMARNRLERILKASYYNEDFMDMRVFEFGTTILLIVGIISIIAAIFRIIVTINDRHNISVAEYSNRDIVSLYNWISGLAVAVCIYFIGMCSYLKNLNYLVRFEIKYSLGIGCIILIALYLIMHIFNFIISRQKEYIGEEKRYLYSVQKLSAIGVITSLAALLLLIFVDNGVTYNIMLNFILNGLSEFNYINVGDILSLVNVLLMISSVISLVIYLHKSFSRVSATAVKPYTLWGYAVPIMLTVLWAFIVGIFLNHKFVADIIIEENILIPLIIGAVAIIVIEIIILRLKSKVSQGTRDVVCGKIEGVEYEEIQKTEKIKTERSFKQVIKKILVFFGIILSYILLSCIFEAGGLFATAGLILWNDSWSFMANSGLYLLPIIFKIVTVVVIGIFVNKKFDFFEMISPRINVSENLTGEGRFRYFSKLTLCLLPLGFGILISLLAGSAGQFWTTMLLIFDSFANCMVVIGAGILLFNGRRVPQIVKYICVLLGMIIIHGLFFAGDYAILKVLDGYSFALPVLQDGKRVISLSVDWEMWITRSIVAFVGFIPCVFYYKVTGSVTIGVIMQILLVNIVMLLLGNNTIGVAVLFAVLMIVFMWIKHVVASCYFNRENELFICGDSEE